MPKFHERMNVPVPWCVSGLYLRLHYEVLNYTVKREMRTVTEGAFIQEKIILQWRDWNESKFEFQKPESWVYSLGSSLLKDTKQTRSLVTLKLQVTSTFLLSRKSFPAPSGARGRQGWAPWAMTRMWWDEQQDVRHAAEHRAHGITALLII